MEQHPLRTEGSEDEAKNTPKETGQEPVTGGSSGYYYDDATGYELYDPAEDDEEEEEDDV